MDGRHPLGIVTHLWRYPIKSLQAEPRRRIDVAHDGIVGDRRRALFVASSGHARSGREYRGKENRRLHTVTTPEAARQLATSHGIELDARSEGPYFDAEPISIVLDRWVVQLEAMLGMPVDPQRFRPNLYVRAAAGFDADEAALTGGTVVAGAVRFAVVSTIERCVTVTYDVSSGEATPLVARVLAQQRANVMGIYCRPTSTGTITVGDELYFER
jgi:uncharacterized protein YcbX